MTSGDNFSSIDDVLRKLSEHSYITDRALATALYLAYNLNKPIFLEGEPGVGKTEVALVLADILVTRLIRLQCYEGLDAATALYEWNYTKQLLRIKMEEQCQTSPEDIGNTINLATRLLGMTTLPLMPKSLIWHGNSFPL